MSKPIIDITNFEGGMNGWEFKSWMPNERQSSAKIIDEQGFKSRACLQFDADGRDDDGILFIQKRLKADKTDPWAVVVVSWWFKGPGVIGVTAWPRVVYLGPPKDLAQRETQHQFHWFQGQDNMVTCPDCNGWYQHTYKMSFPDGLDELQVCVGWKINWETLRTLYMDDVLLLVS
jgi:hypothetical protein